MTTSSQRVAIFGATSDIATAVARRLAEDGATLVIIARDAVRTEAAVADLKVRGAADVVGQAADLSTSVGAVSAAEAAWQAFGGLDVVLIAFGTLPHQKTAEADAQTTEAALVLNFIRPCQICNTLAPRLEKQGFGTLAVITSVAGDRGRQSNYLYGAAKAGLQRFLEGLRHRLFRCGVRVLDVRPGFVSTKMTAHLPQRGRLWAQPDRIADDIISAIEAGRAVVYTPWFWRWIMMAVRHLPRPLFHRSSL